MQQEGFFHNHSFNMNLSSKRPSFIDTMGPNINENRFDNSDFYDKSSYLSTNERPKAIIDFKGMTAREKNLIDKGGVTGADLGGKSEGLLYNPEQAKIRTTMRNL